MSNPHPKQEIDKIAELSNAEFDFSTHTIVAAYVGSKAHNTYVEKEDPTTDDIDVQGVFCPPPDHIVGLKNIESWVQQADLDIGDGLKKYDWTYHSLRKYCQLLLKANPNVLCLLYLEPRFYMVKSPVFDRIIENRDMFASIQAYDSFAGYAYAQLQRMERYETNGRMGDKRKQLVDQFGYDVKNAAHAMRLLYMGMDYIKTGSMVVWQPEDRASLLKSVKKGEWTLEQVKLAAESLYDSLRELKETSPLPKKPDYVGANKLVTELHLEFWEERGYL